MCNMAEESTTRCTLDCEELLLRNSESTPYVGNAFEVDDPDEDDKLLAGKFETTPYVGNAFEVDDPDEDDKLLAGKFETTPYVGNAFEVDDPDEDDKLLAGKFETTPYVGNAFEVDDKLLAELFETTCGEIPKSVPRDRNSSAAGTLDASVQTKATSTSASGSHSIAGKELKKMVDLFSKDMPAALTENQLVDIIRKGKGVCYIKRKDSRGRLISFTGFHYGGGWIMTAAHCNEEKRHLKKSEVTFSWIDDNGEQSRHFEPRNRLGFIAERVVAKSSTQKSFEKDLALFKIGKQYEKGKRQDDFEAWEVEEQEFVDTVLLETNIMVQTPSTVQLSLDMLIVHIFFEFPKSSGPRKRFVLTKPSAIDDNRDEFEFLSPSPHGASGSPILVFASRFSDNSPEYSLCGVMIGGYEESPKLQIAETKPSCKEFTDLIRLVISKVETLNSITLTRDKCTNLTQELKETFDEKIDKLVQEIKAIGKEKNLIFSII